MFIESVRSICYGITLACVAQSAAPDDIPPQPVDGPIKWVYNYAEGKELAQKTGKPMLVVFRCER